MDISWINQTVLTKQPGRTEPGPVGRVSVEPSPGGSNIPQLPSGLMRQNTDISGFPHSVVKQGSVSLGFPNWSPEIRLL